MGDHEASRFGSRAVITGAHDPHGSSLAAQATAPGLYRLGSEQALDIVLHRGELPDTDSYVFGRYDGESRFRTDQKLQDVRNRSPARLARKVDRERGTGEGAGVRLQGNS